jgi:hypothetical protein
MKFDINRVYTCVNADQLKVGSKVYVAFDIASLKSRVSENYRNSLCTIDSIMADSYSERFKVNNNCYALAYLVSEPEEKKLVWTDLKIGDVIRNGVFTHLVTGIHNFEQTNKHIFVSGAWLSDEELEEWEKVE